MMAANFSTSTPRYLPDRWTLPELTDENRAFFTSAKLRVQRCADCRMVQHPPDEVCHACQSVEFDYVEAQATGIVESYTIVHHAVHAMLKAAVPYNVVVVALDEYPGVRIVGNVIDVGPTELKIGQAMAASWVEIPPDDTRLETIHLLQWTAMEAS
jgi:uncharacterized protein